MVEITDEMRKRTYEQRRWAADALRATGWSDADIAAMEEDVMRVVANLEFGSSVRH